MILGQHLDSYLNNSNSLYASYSSPAGIVKKRSVTFSNCLLVAEARDWLVLENAFIEDVISYKKLQNTSLNHKEVLVFLPFFYKYI